MAVNEMESKYLVELLIKDIRVRSDGVNKHLMFVGKKPILETELDYISNYITEWDKVRKDRPVDQTIQAIVNYMTVALGYSLVESMQTSTIMLE